MGALYTVRASLSTRDWVARRTTDDIVPAGLFDYDNLVAQVCAFRDGKNWSGLGEIGMRPGSFVYRRILGFLVEANDPL